MTALKRLGLVLALFVAWFAQATAFAADLTVYFFDVGQGDAILIVSPAGKTVLIDAGPPEAAAELEARLKQILAAPIDLLVMTHPHADHIGSMARVINAVGVRIFMDPGYEHSSSMYDKLLSLVEEKQIPVRNAEAGRNVDLGGGASLRILAPAKPLISGSRSDANANSVVARLTYGNTAFYFAGDSEADTERRILKGEEELRADVYKVAHHASRHSSTEALLARIQPKVAVVSVGANNGYGHPTRETLDRLESVGAKVFRTDLDGEVVARSDGKKVTLTSGRPEAGAGPMIAAATPAAVLAATEGAKKKPAASEDAEEEPAPKKKSKKKAAVEEDDSSASADEEEPAPRKKSKKKAVVEEDDGAGADEEEDAPPKKKSKKKKASADDGDDEEKPAKKAKKGSGGEGGFVASKNSSVFHAAGCGGAARIKENNLVQYSTRDEAIEDGKRPAKDCDP